MSKSKQARREKVGGPSNNPQNLAASMSPLPGAPQGPGNIQNNPGNAMRANQPQVGSMSGFNAFPYGDVEGTGIPQKDGRMGGVYAGPTSGQPENAVMGRGLNGQVPYNYQQQPPAQAEEGLEGMRFMADAKGRGLVGNEFMGMLGQGPAPANSGPEPPVSPRELPLQGMPSAEAAPQGARKSGGMNTGSGKRG